MQTYFNEIADHLGTLLQGEEVYTASFSAEESDFVRMNKSEVRQAGSVTDRSIEVDLIDGNRHAAGSSSLSGDAEIDRLRVAALLGDLREKRAALPEDPHLLYATDVTSTERVAENRLPAPHEAVDQVRDAGKGRDLVGIYAQGGIHRGFASSLGQRNWFTNHSFNLDWSFYHAADKAVKEGYAGFEWDTAELQRKVDLAAKKLDALGRKSHTVEPGRYRVYLAPAALSDIVGLLCWGGFSLKMHKTKQTPLLKMTEDGVTMDARVTIAEDTVGGVAPNFQDAGFLRPDRVELIAGGAYKDCLVSPRSAKEYDVENNGADAWETPESLEVNAGGLPTENALAELGTGVWIGNVWYLNYSDRSNCRTTGMTRFATFWVEDGEIKAPLDVMRFDETVYRMLGENLVDLTAERDLILDAASYGGRSVASGRMPGALVEDFTFTL